MTDLKRILDDHVLWLFNDENGVKANLRGANLQDANLRGANLRGANLQWANLQDSNWPTYPQLYINGELVGGCDIIIDLYNKGELVKMLAAASGGEAKA